MSIDLTPEDQQAAEALVASGRFASIADAVHAGLQAVQEDSEWPSYANDRIEAGWADMEAGRTIPAEEFEEWLNSKMPQRA